MVLSENHQLMQKLFRQFAETEFTPALLDRLDETGEFDWDIHNKMAAAGFMGAKIPVKYGGQGGDTLTHVLLIEEFARVSPVLSIYANTSNSLGSGPLLACANEEQLMRYLPDVAAGKSILAFCLTEPDAGSDAGGVMTTAVPTEDGWVLNGRKRFVSGAPVRAIEREIRDLSANADNLNLSLNQFRNLDRVAARAAKLGMGKPSGNQIRVVRLPAALDNTSTQSAGNTSAEEMKE